MFLTDGNPTSAEKDPDKIVNEVTNRNYNQAEIYTIAIGTDANKNFLRSLSKRNNGLAAVISDPDNVRQGLEELYQRIARPVLRNVFVSFTKYPGQESNRVDLQSLTRPSRNIVTQGSEMLVAGTALRLKREDPPLVVEVSGQTSHGSFSFEDEFQVNVNIDPEVLKKVRAFIKVKELLQDAKDAKAANDSDSGSIFREAALELSLRYGFLTEVTSFILTHDVKRTIINPHNPNCALNNNVGIVIRVEDIPNGSEEIGFDSVPAFSSFFIPEVSAASRPQAQPEEYPSYGAPQAQIPIDYYTCLLCSITQQAPAPAPMPVPVPRPQRPAPTPRPTRPPIVQECRYDPVTGGCQSGRRPTTTTTTIPDSAFITGGGSRCRVTVTPVRGDPVTFSQSLIDLTSTHRDLSRLRVVSVSVEGSCCWNIYKDTYYNGDFRAFGEGLHNDRSIPRFFTKIGSILLDAECQQA